MLNSGQMQTTNSPKNSASCPPGIVAARFALASKWHKGERSGERTVCMIRLHTCVEARVITAGPAKGSTSAESEAPKYGTDVDVINVFWLRDNEYHDANRKRPDPIHHHYRVPHRKFLG